MAGFLGLFGGKKEDKEAFFLDSDESKSLGDIEYMRTPNTVRRTFAKRPGETEHKEFIQDVTAMGRVVADVSADEFKPKERKRVERQLINEKNYPTFGGGSVKTAGSVSADDLAAARAKGKPEEEEVAAKPQATAAAPAGNQRSADSHMDMFRNMVKDMNKHG